MANFTLFTRNFERLCLEKGKSPSACLVDMGFSNSAYTYWKKSRNIPRMTSLVKISDYFGVTVAELLGETEETEDIPAPNVSKTFGVKPMTYTNRLPIYGIVSAGRGAFAEEDILGYEFADEQYSKTEYFWLEVSGDSMSPRIDDGDLILVHKQEWIDDGQIGVFVISGLAYVKKIEYNQDDVNLISFNPYYPPMHYTPDESEAIYVIGRVIESKRKYK